MRSQEKTPPNKGGTAEEQEAKKEKRGTPPLKRKGERERGVRSKEKMPPKKKELPKIRRRRERKRALRR